MKATAQNTADNYLLHMYKNYYKEISEKYNLFEERTGLKLDRAFGRITISATDILTDIGDDNLKYEYFGYGGLGIMGIAIDFPKAKNLNDLYFKSEEIKNAIKNLVQVIDQINEDQRNSIKIIHEQHGMPKQQHCIIALNARA